MIVDESHRARRRKVPKVDASADEIDERAVPNKLMAFLREIDATVDPRSTFTWCWAICRRIVRRSSIGGCFVIPAFTE